MTVRDYDDVPGTYVLDSRNYRKGYHLNMFLMSLNKSEAARGLCGLMRQPICKPTN